MFSGCRNVDWSMNRLFYSLKARFLAKTGSIFRKILVSLFKYKLSVTSSLLRSFVMNEAVRFCSLFTSAASEAVILTKYKPKTPETTNR